MLLDHKIVAGCGNIYACEALFRAGIHPARKVKDTSHQERQMLFYYVQEVLKEGIDNGKVCGHDIEQKVIASRNSHFCPYCQK